jgi:hypothetical protein
MAPTDNLDAWINFDWVRNFGDEVSDEGDAFGIAAATRLGITDETGIAGRVEYVWIEDDVIGASEDGELFTLTGTIDHALTDSLKVRGELRYDRSLEDDAARFSSGDQDSFVGLAEIYYEF